ncbi:MAG: UDP-N-acetylmuramate dehydrogenase [Pyrinomonadaceae bacterium]
MALDFCFMDFKIRQNLSLAPLTTLKIGGNARFFVEAKTENEIIKAVKFAEQNNLRLFVLGGGSNVLISDAGFDGLVLQIALKGIAVQEKDKKIYVTAQAGEDWDAFCAFCAGENLQGVECLSGIPGFVGATPVQNVGGYGQEVSETIVIVRAFDRKTNHILELTNADCKFSYRASIFNTTEKNRFIVLSVTYALNSGSEPKIAYRDLQEFFDGKTPTLQETREAVLQIRRAKSMVIEEKDPNSKSAGSFFKNPFVSPEKFVEIERQAESLGIEKAPSFKVDEKNVKIPAAWLIEQSGFHKGFKFGNVGLSTKHTLAIVNLGHANAAEIVELKNKIQSQVKINFDIDLIPEPVFVGFTEN